MIKRTFILKKDLFKVKKGRIFHTTYDGKTVYPFFTDDEFIHSDEYFPYKFPIEIVEKDSEWFDEVTERRDFVKQVSGTYKFYIPNNFELPNYIQQREVRKNGILVGHVTNFDSENGEATIELLPEFVESVWKDIAGPYVGTVSSRTMNDEKLSDVIDDLFKPNESKESKSITLEEENEDFGDFFSVDDIIDPPRPAYSKPVVLSPSDLEDIDFFQIDD